ncbi:MAG: DNA-binding protein [Lachnospiraceae bacterium]|nr:DNA-binding protein [Lachnospiraceae bacterium]
MNGISVEQKENKQESLKDKYMLTVKEAAFYFNIGTKKMRRIAEDNLGNIAVYSGNRFLIIRPKFEDFILNSSEI